MENIQPNEITPQPAPEAFEIERRLRRVTAAITLLGTIAGGAAAGWKMALGILLGGLLSLLNERWLSTSTRTILEYASSTGNPSAPKASKFIFRFVVVGAIIAIAAQTGYFNLLGIGIGFTAFVGAAMIEAFYQAIHFKSEV